VTASGATLSFLGGGAAGLLEGGLQDEILGRVARQIHLREHDKISPLPGGLGARRAHNIRIAGDIADDRGGLGQRKHEPVGGGGLGKSHECHLKRAGGRGNGRRAPSPSLVIAVQVH
jgi:hypothetical protein